MSQTISQTKSSTLELSIIIPALNEAKSLPLLLADLVCQKKVTFELIVIDGGSTDGTCELVKAFTYPEKIEIRLLRTSSGRSIQMNEGVKQACAPDLLFLHADTRIDNDMLLANAKLCIDKKRQELKKDNVAGHFGLSFSNKQRGYSKAYYFYEAKTRLNRDGCINGDQGCWISRQYFHSLGMYDESLGFMEDLRLAKKIFNDGVWVSLPGTIQTSARRFNLEGFTERQTLNALISNFEYIELKEYFQQAKNVYAHQSLSSRLVLKPFFEIAHKTLFHNGVFEGIMNWYKTGRYVALNVWQLAFAMDCARNRKSGLVSGKGKIPWLKFYDNWVRVLVTSIPGNILVALIALAWFYGSLFAFKDEVGS